MQDDDEPARDDNAREFEITEVAARDDDMHWDLRLSDESFVVLERERFDRTVPRDLEPRVYDTLRLYYATSDIPRAELDAVRALGLDSATIRGADLNGIRLYHETDEEIELARWQREIDATLADRERFNEAPKQLDERVAALRPALRGRIARLRAIDEDFRWKYEEMVLRILEDADKIAAWLCREHGWTAGDVEERLAQEAVDAFKRLPSSAQNRHVAGLQCDAGRTFGEACALAQALIEGRPV